MNNEISIEQIKNHIYAVENQRCEVLPVGFELNAFRELLAYREAESKPVAWRRLSYENYRYCSNPEIVRKARESGVDYVPVYASPVLGQTPESINPELLEALKDARYKLYGSGPGNPKIDAAIAKATGESE